MKLSPVTLIQRVKLTSSIFTFYAKTAPVYDFKLLLVVLHPFVKEFFKTIY